MSFSRLCPLIVAASLAFPLAAAEPPRMETYAGGGLGGDTALQVRLEQPRGLAVDAAGNVLVADTTANRVLSIAKDGKVRVAAGDGGTGDGGDGGPAAAAHVPGPVGLAFDRAGNLYISSNAVLGSSRIRAVSANDGNIYAFAGAGQQTNDGALAHESRLGEVRGLFADGDGHLFFTEIDGISQRGRVRRVDAGDRTLVTTIGGRAPAFVWSQPADGVPAAEAVLVNPTGLAVDRSWNLYVAEGGSPRVRVLTAATGRMSTVVGNGVAGFGGDDGPAPAARLSQPSWLAVDAQGNLLIADTGNHRVRRVESATGTIRTMAGSGQQGFDGDGGAATAAKLNAPEGLAFDAVGNLLIADRGNHRIRSVDARTGAIRTIAGRDYAVPDGILASNLALGQASAMVVDAADNLYIWIDDSLMGRLLRIDAKSRRTATLLQADRDTIAGATGLAIDPAGAVYIAFADAAKVARLDPGAARLTPIAGTGSTGSGGDGGPATAAQLEKPDGLALDGRGGLLIADRQANRVRRVDLQTSVITTLAGGDGKGFRGDGGPAQRSLLNEPTGMAVDAAGNVFVVDSGNHRVRRIDAATGVITTVAGNGKGGVTADGALAATSPLLPLSVTVDRQGDLVIGDGVGLVRRIARGTGLLQTIAGSNPLGGFGGDGGPPTAALLRMPRSLAFDSRGNLYILDAFNERIRRVVFNP